MLTTQQWRADQQAPRLYQMFPPDGFAMRHPILVWWLVLEVLGLLAFPLTFVLLSNLVDRGFVVAKTIGLLVVGYLVWIAASVGLAPYDRGPILGAVGVLAVAGLGVGLHLRREIGAFLRLQWRYVLSAEAVFLAGFALFLLLRMWYPDLGHQFSPVSPGNTGSGRMGEKQMELAFLNAIVRSRVFPPYDPFFAHGYINYYYYGFVLVGTLCKLTQILPATGFNLAIATFFAMLVGNVFTVALSLTRRIVPGVVAAVLVGVIGNLNGAWQLVSDLMSVSPVHSDFPIFGGLVDVFAGLGQAVFARAPLPPFDFWGPTRIIPPPGMPISEFPYFTYLFADLHPHLMAFPLTAAAVAVGVSLLLGSEGQGWRLVLSLLLSAILTGAIAATNPWDFPTYLVVIALGALVGAYALRRRIDRTVLLRPLLWLGAVGILTFLLYLPFQRSYHTVFQTGIGLVRNIKPEALQPAVCPQGVSSCPDLAREGLVTPLHIYLEHFGLFVFLLASYLVFLLAVQAGGAARWKRWLTRAQFAVYYRERLRHVRRSARVARRMRRAQEAVLDPSLVMGLLILVIGLLVFQYQLMAFLVAIIGLIGLLLLRLGRRLPAEQLFLLALLLVPLGLSLLTQIFYIKDFLDGGAWFRMNTIFKFYNQIWVLFAVTAAPALYYLVAGWEQETVSGPRAADVRAGSVYPDGAEPSEDRRQPISPAAVPAGVVTSATSETGLAEASPESWPIRDLVVVSSQPATSPEEVRPLAPVRIRAWERLRRFVDKHPLWSTAATLLFAGSLVYTYAGTVARETYRQSWLPENSVPFTLDGMAFMKTAYPEEDAAISWLNGHVRGAPVMAEAYSPDGYTWFSRVAMFTGLPDIFNGIHEQEQRYGDELGSRSDDVQTLYNSTSQQDAWSIIHKYGVQYIYVGFSERQHYSASGLAKFDQMAGHGLTVVYRHGNTTIYRVST